MVEKAQVAFFHGLHKVAGLIVAHAIPGSDLSGRCLQILPGVTARLALEQPVVHDVSFLSGYILKNKVASARRGAGRARGGKSFLKKGPLPCIPLLSQKLFLWTVRDVPVADRNDITIVICKRRKSHVTICNGRTTAERACRPPLSSSSSASPPFPPASLSLPAVHAHPAAASMPAPDPRGTGNLRRPSSSSRS